jgi:4-amino-4-deoxy-L-arabinose transferase-like glycosyltransferase
MTGSSSGTLAPPSALPRRASASRSLAARPWAPHLALVPVLALSAVLNVHNLSQNGYANIFYSAGAKSMLRSLHNFFFVSFDPGGLIMVDKPPLGLWLQAASAKLFGFGPLALLLPEAIAGVLAVAVLYWILAPRFGIAAGLAGATALAVFPSFVAVSRDNGVDPLLILLMTLACAAGVRAAETGRWRWLLGSAVLVGLAFNTKTLAAWLVVPGIALAYAVCAPLALVRRLARLAVAGVLMAAVCFCWIAAVELTPASKRPYVGGSTDNSELGLAFEYNGFGRVEGQVGGPGRAPFKPGAFVRAQRTRPPQHRSAQRRAAQGGSRSASPGAVQAAESANKPIPFGGPAGPLRLFGTGLGDQGGWLLPFALVGAIAALALVLAGSRAGGAGTDDSSPCAGWAARRRDPRLAALLVLGGWFACQVAILSFSNGIVHPYYVSALGPGAAAMAGAGAIALARLAQRPGWDWRRLLAPAAIVATVAAQVVLLQRAHYLHWLQPVLIAGGAAAAAALLWGRGVAPYALAAALCLLLVAPTAYSTTTWRKPVQGTFPAAGPRQATGAGGVGLYAPDVQRDRDLIAYLRTHGATKRWALLTTSSVTAAPFILMGLDAGSLAGYSGTDPAIDGRRLARLVARGEARYVVLGGEFSTRGGNRATAAVLGACRQLPQQAWQAVPRFLHTLVLFDCAGRERGLRSEPPPKPL